MIRKKRVVPGRYQLFPCISHSNSPSRSYSPWSLSFLVKFWERSCFAFLVSPVHPCRFGTMSDTSLPSLQLSLSLYPSITIPQTVDQSSERSYLVQELLPSAGSLFLLPFPITSITSAI